MKPTKIWPGSMGSALIRSILCTVNACHRGDKRLFLLVWGDVEVGYIYVEERFSGLRAIMLLLKR